MKQVSFKELLALWDTLCDKHLKPLYRKKDIDPDKHRALIARLNEEWQAIRTKAGWTGKEEIEAYKDLHKWQRQRFMSIIAEARTGAKEA